MPNISINFNTYFFIERYDFNRLLIYVDNILVRESNVSFLMFIVLENSDNKLFHVRFWVNQNSITSFSWHLLRPILTQFLFTSYLYLPDFDS